MIYFPKSDKTDERSKTAKCFSDVYFSEFFALLGITAMSLSLGMLPQESGKGSVLFLGAGDYAVYASELHDWCSSGGTVIALGSGGIAELCEMREVGTVCADTPYTLNGHLLFSDDMMSPCRRLPVEADIRHCRPCEEKKMPVRVLATSEEYGLPLVFSRTVGDGNIVYFAFSLLQTLCYKTQGKPVTRDTNGDGYMRSCDSIITDWSDTFAMPAVDAYLHFIEELLLSCDDIPFIHQVPADDGVPCDYALYFAGDEDLCGKQMFEANRELRSRGVPYHVHLQPRDYRDFTVTAEQFHALEQEGLGLSLHFDFITDKSYRYDFEALRAQTELYRSAFGKLPAVCNTHWCIYNGFGETARWYRKLGLAATFCQVGMNTDFADINKMNYYGFAYGTTYPAQSFDDKRYGHKPTGIYDLKIAFYEPRVHGDADEKRIDELMRLTCDWALTTNIFIHPVYLVEDKTAVLAAVDRILEAGKGKRVAILQTSDLVQWWHADAVPQRRIRSRVLCAYGNKSAAGRASDDRRRDGGRI